MGLFAVVGQLISGLGLSSAAGLNAYLPLLAIGIMGKMGYAHLTGPYAALSADATLAVLGILAALDFVADKVPAVDHAMHVIGAIIHPVAGAIVFGSQTNAITGLPPALMLAAGLVVAGGFHVTRSAVRPVATATTAGIANPFISLAEDILSATLSIVAILAPIVCFCLLVLLGLLIVKSWSAIQTGFSRIFGRRPSPAAS